MGRDADTPLPATVVRPRVIVSSADTTYASSLATLLVGRGLEAVARSVSLADEGDCRALACCDVLVMEIGGPSGLPEQPVESLHEVAPVLEIIALASDPLVESAVRALREGVFEVLQHPVAIDSLIQTIELACQRKRRAEARLRELEENHRWHNTRRGGGSRSAVGRPERKTR